MKEYYERLMHGIHTDMSALGWWDNVNEWTAITKLMLTVTEVAEATEGDRKNLPDDKLPHRRMLEVELADTMIRVLDMGQHFGFSIDPNIERRINMYYNDISEVLMPTPPALFTIVGKTVDFSRDFNDSSFSKLVAIIQAVADYTDCDIKSAIPEKMLFNNKRADHKRENRAKKHGKGY